MKKGSFYKLLFGLVVVASVLVIYKKTAVKNSSLVNQKKDTTWQVPDITKLPAGDSADLVRYGKDLIANTAVYLGPRGKVAAMSNGLNCQNCHLDAGTRLNTNSFAAVAHSYPKFRNRSGKIESIEFRINECMERSLNGSSLDSLSREMQAMKAYIVWLGKGYHPPPDPAISGTGPIGWLKRPADPVAGKAVFATRCVSCHGAGGEGLFKPDSLSYLYPPLWGPNSYNVSAGMYRLTRLAGFIKYGMPFSATPLAPQLTDEEAWDVAAFINSQQRPEKFFKYDWPNIATKPPDYPFAPFADSFAAAQHKYGPFEGIIAASKKKPK